MPDISFDLSVRFSGASYALRASAPATGDLSVQPFALPFDLGELPRLRKEVATWIRQVRITRLGGPEEQRLARTFGQALFERLFAGEVLAAFRSIRARER